MAEEIQSGTDKGAGSKQNPQGHLPAQHGGKPPVQQVNQQPKAQAAPAAQKPAAGAAPSTPKPQTQQQPKQAMQAGKPAAAKRNDNPDFRGIVRIVGKDIDGHLTLFKALIRVKGVGTNLARAMLDPIAAELKVKTDVQVGDLSEAQTDRIDEMLKDPTHHGVPAFMLNHSNDTETGKNRHLLMTDLDFASRQKVQLEKDVRSWKGFRYSLGQPVRGQHTRTTGRKGLTVGVLKKALKAQKTAAAGKAQDAGKDKK